MQANQLRLWFSAMAYVLVDTSAPRRPAPYAVRRRRSRDYPAQAVEARCSGAHQRAPHSLRSRISLPEQDRVRAGVPRSPACFRLLLNPYAVPETNRAPSLRVPTHANWDSHCGKPNTRGLAIREPQTTASQPGQSYPPTARKMAFAGPYCPTKLVTFEKSRLAGHEQ
jgi:hypothetical protein